MRFLCLWVWCESCAGFLWVILLFSVSHLQTSPEFTRIFPAGGIRRASMWAQGNLAANPARLSLPGQLRTLAVRFLSPRAEAVMCFKRAGVNYQERKVSKAVTPGFAANLHGRHLRLLHLRAIALVEGRSGHSLWASPCPPKPKPPRASAYRTADARMSHSASLRLQTSTGEMNNPASSAESAGFTA